MIKKFAFIAFMAALSLCLNACKGKIVAKVKTTPDQVAKIGSFSTYAWNPNASTKLGKERIQDIKDLDAVISFAVEKELNSRGFKKVSYEEADMSLEYHAALFDAMMEAQGGGVPSRTAEWQVGSDGSRSLIVEYEKGALAIKVLEGQSESILWIGMASAVANPNRTSGKRKELINEGITLLMEEFPRSK